MLNRFATMLPLSALVLALASCASVSDGPSGIPEPAAAAPEEAKTTPADAAAASEAEINTTIAAVDDEAEAAPPGSSASDGAVGDEISHALSQKIPLELNDDVSRWIDFFTAKDRNRFQRFLERGERYKGQIMALLREQGVPTEIYYQAMIESGFATAATSKARAVGIWQFMAETGRRYGLRIDRYVDERRDPLRSTIAAALYMKDLYNVFQSWYLAIAAYNAGEGRIMNTIMRAKTRDFWAMVKLRVLPNETLNYIPKFLAASMIGHNPKQYGFDDLVLEPPPQLVSVPVPSPLRLSDIANLSGMPVQLLREFNPHLIRDITPPGVDTYRIWVPLDEAAGLESLSERLSALRIRGLRQLGATSGVGRGGDASPARGEAAVHTALKGESLAQIAAAYGLSVRRLMQLNHLRSHRIIAGTQLVLTSKSALQAQASGGPRYQVQAGDSLRSIARRFGVSMQDLKRWNGLRRNGVTAGQILRVSEQKG